ncbi:prepilin-type N-terminal cleavage/methylation domain-containing protein [Candidatus Sodalis sp. SoCistrobi]|uniref:prepilin-type N-terminal cleavage/methylation domain-containing protein n=1 Tax=Candidatus Sodalis sp. SoCistrobi TaxID=1922216 RepID=UPI000ABA5908|nr:prepilin-type N-terminal cleavage/methylation domain-containing protein [Candidatus Sodalis sp. SoCistrobi]
MHSFLNQTDRDSGYTLMELLLVLTLTALLMLAGSYGWRQQQSARQLTSSAQQLLDFIVRQQWHAAWGNRRCRLTAITGDRWQLRGDPQCGLVREAADGARCIAPYAGVHLSVSTVGELSLGGVRHTAGAPRAQQFGGAAAGGALRSRPGPAVQRARALGGDPAVLTCRTEAGGATLRPVSAGAGAAAPAGQMAAGGAQEGFSLPELLAALAACSLLLTVALHLFPSLQRSIEGAMLQLRLMRQLDLCALAIAKDVRRAGFSQQGGTPHTLWIDKRQGEPPGSCLVVGYDYLCAQRCARAVDYGNVRLSSAPRGVRDSARY